LRVHVTLAAQHIVERRAVDPWHRVRVQVDGERRAQARHRGLAVAARQRRARNEHHAGHEGQNYREERERDPFEPIDSHGPSAYRSTRRKL